MIKRFLYYFIQRNQIALLTSFILIMMSLGFLTISDKVRLLNLILKGNFLQIFATVMSIVVVLSFILFKYLEVGSFKSGETIKDEELRHEIDDLKIEFLRHKKRSGTSEEEDSINKIINNIIHNTLTEDFIKSKINNVFSEKTIEESKQKKLYKDFDNIENRIQSELTRLRKSANLNLVIGTITTLLAICILGFEVINSNLNFGNYTTFLSHYLPRLSLVVFIEIFAFFFLKIYKNNLEDIKYFNNEKTNIDFKIISLKTAIYQENSDLIKISIEELLKTERNFVLKKGESTVELDRMRYNNDDKKLLSKIIANVVDK